MSMIDFAQIRQSHDLSSVIERYLGPPHKGQTWFCPFHDDRSNPNFTIKDEFYRCWSAQCGAKGDATDFVARMEQITQAQAAQILGHTLDFGMTPAELAAKRESIRQERLSKLKQERATALAKLAKLDNLIARYHQSLLADMQQQSMLAQDGIDLQMIKRFHLGYCDRCPTYYNPSDPQDRASSITFPYYNSGTLVGVTHRLLDRERDKYRPQVKNQPKSLFNIDSLKRAINPDPLFSFLAPRQALLVEGEKKAIYLDGRFNFPVAGLPGALTWQDDFADHFDGIERLYLVLDPDVSDKIYNTIATALPGIECRRCYILHKPDDFFTLYGGTIRDFLSMLNWSRKL